MSLPVSVVMPELLENVTAVVDMEVLVMFSVLPLIERSPNVAASGEPVTLMVEVAVTITLPEAA